MRSYGTVLAAIGLAGLAHADNAPVFRRQSAFLNSTTSAVPSSSITSSAISSASVVPSSSSNSSVASSTSTAPAIPSGATNVPQAFILEALQVPATRKRQAVAGGFIGNGGPASTTNCGAATQWTIVNGQLLSGGQVVSADLGQNYEPFAVSAAVGDVSTTWGLTASNQLFWDNAAFVDGTAGFCQDPTGQVYITFTGPANFPPNCVAAALVAIPVSDCINGVITATVTAPIATATVTALPTALATLSLPPGLYFPGTAVPGEYCVPVVESWVVGQTTLLPEPTILA